MFDDITAIEGIRVGHDTNLDAGTGCTVLLCDTTALVVWMCVEVPCYSRDGSAPSHAYG